MIRINKSLPIPTNLSGDGVTQTDVLKRKFALDSASFTTRPGVRVKDISKMDIDRDIYGNSDVKQRLIADQHDKCCFCEAKFSDNSFGDVEHYRPKGAYKKKGERRNTYPGYYWLAYDWANLIFSCEICNRKYKRNDFPLGDELTRKPNHLHANAIEDEDTLLIDPTREDPRNFITFKEEVPVPIAGSEKGKTSIKVYGLERMNDSRLDYLILLDALLSFCKIDVTDESNVQQAMLTFKFTRAEVLEKVSKAQGFFNEAATDRGKFASCVRSKFPHLPII